VEAFIRSLEIVIPTPIGFFLGYFDYICKNS
jgi:hypothetical protein